MSEQDSTTIRVALMPDQDLEEAILDAVEATRIQSVIAAGNVDLQYTILGPGDNGWMLVRVNGPRAVIDVFRADGIAQD